NGTTLVTGGTLELTGSLGGVTLVSGTGTLSGVGTARDVMVQDGGAISPGSSIGTFTVDGGIVFRSGSTLLVETNPADLSSDLIHVTGSAQLEGGTVRHVGLDAPYPLDSSYLILTADDGVSGTFDEV